MNYGKRVDDPGYLGAPYDSDETANLAKRSETYERYGLGKRGGDEWKQAGVKMNYSQGYWDNEKVVTQKKESKKEDRPVMDFGERKFEDKDFMLKDHKDNFRDDLGTEKYALRQNLDEMMIDEVKTKEIDPSNKAEDLTDAARGCILGAFLGDAIGGVLEFFKTQITQDDIDWAFTLPGGG